MKYVTAQYFATYGDSFPLTDGQKKIDRILHQTSGHEADGKKIDRILYETSRIRLMTDDFTRKVFRQRGYREGEFRTGESAWTSPGIKIEGNILTHQGPEVCGECTVSPGWREIRHGARYFTPFTREMPRMEVFIQEIGESQEVGVGAVFEGYDHHGMPGWKDGSVGYHSDDGKIYENSGKGREFGDTLAYRGDLITCEVDFDREENGVIPVNFFLNCKEVGQATMSYTGEREDCLPFPYIGLRGKGTRVLVEMCSSKAKRAELPAAEEPSQTDMLKKQKGSIEEQMGFIREQLKSRRKEMEIMEKNIKTKMRNMEKNMKKEMEEQKQLLLQLVHPEKNT